MKKTLLSEIEAKEVVEAIVQAEKYTSGEIRVHIDNKTEAEPLERATQLFYELGMDSTKERNGVLFYVGIEDHSFAIVGDEGIHRVVESDFWDSTKEIVITHFKQKKFTEGLINGILNVGIKLKEFFPFKDNDQNELSNELSGL
jgi:uncharacterized membrane protein